MLKTLFAFVAAWLLAFAPGAFAPAAAAPPKGGTSATVTSAAANSALPADPGYVLGANDVITVQVYGQPDAGVGTTRIKADGTIVMPLIGVVKAEGLTQIELANLITKKFVSGGFLKSPFVNVEINAFQSKTVNVAGKVGAPGVYPLDKPYRVLEMLLKSGWLREQGANYVYLRRASDGKELRLEADALTRGAPDKDVELHPGDTLFVPDADTFYIYGAIARPGVFPIIKDMTLRQALTIAGGVTAAGSMKKVALIRAGGKEEKATIDQPVQKGDVYIVKERLF